MNATATTGRRPTPTREALFIRLQTPDGAPLFEDVTDQVGGLLPEHLRPRASCSLRASSESVVFSLRHISQRQAAAFASARLEMPYSTLAWLQRFAAEHRSDVAADTALVRFGDDLHRLTVRVDDDGEVALAVPSGAVEPDVEQGKRTLRLTLLLHSQVLDRPVAMGFLGHLAKPGNAVGLVRATSRALHSLSLLQEFRTVTGFERVDVPAGESRPVLAASAVPDIEVAVPVSLHDTDRDGNMAAVADGTVKVRVGFRGRISYTFEPSAGIAHIFDPYRPTVERTVQDILAETLGPDDMARITVAVAIGEFDESAAERIRSTLVEHLTAGADFTPSRPGHSGMYKLRA